MSYLDHTPYSLVQGHVSARFAAVSRKVWSGKYSALHLKNFKTVFGLLHPQFEGFRQVRKLQWNLY